MLISMENNMRDYQMEKEAREKRILAYLRNAVLVLRKRVMPMNTMEVLTLETDKILILIMPLTRCNYNCSILFFVNNPIHFINTSTPISTKISL